MKRRKIMDFIRFFLILLVPGLIAATVYNCFNPCKVKHLISTTLIFDLLIFLINITGLYYFKGICTFTQLTYYFDCLSFTRKYALLSILIGIILAIIFGLIYKCWFAWRKCTCKE